MNLSFQQDRCAIIVPCFNEAARLQSECFLSFLESTSDVDIVFVNDGSTDETLTVLQRLLADADNRVRVTSLPKNSGKAEAVRQGLLWGLQKNYPIVGFWDADLATPLEAIVQFHEVLKRRSEVEVVWGTRLPLFGHEIDRDFIRRQIGRGFSFSSALAVGVPIRDALCGAKLFRSTDRLYAVLKRRFSSRWIFDVELIARLRSLVSGHETARLSDVLFEFPLERWDEIAGSKLRMIDFVRATAELVDLYLKYRSPLARPYSEAGRDGFILAESAIVLQEITTSGTEFDPHIVRRAA